MLAPLRYFTLLRTTNKSLLYLGNMPFTAYLQLIWQCPVGDDWIKLLSFFKSVKGNIACLNLVNGARSPDNKAESKKTSRKRCWPKHNKTSGIL